LGQEGVTQLVQQQRQHVTQQLLLLLLLLLLWVTRTGRRHIAISLR
jgi:uncharacterized membrane protein YjgN (DUF898 family)